MTTEHTNTQSQDSVLFADEGGAASGAKSASQAAYRVLARKYRPRHFDELVGQDALVRTLKNAIETGRVAQAYVLTGVRGVGKTTTARIIARALNYVGPDGKAGPTTGPTDDCETCRTIAEGFHPDVLEIDAASNNGVEKIRELTDGVRYAPASARYKVYIIDEVHMLTTAAWNALLKTLEEPPAHVIFIFATTEIHKIPVTVLSRCQRFDLLRIPPDKLSAYYKTICGKENVPFEDEAIDIIGRVADGSVRDGLSLLDQSIARGFGEVKADQVREMIGMSDSARILDLLEACLKGDVETALAISDELHARGGLVPTILESLLEYVHILTKFRAVPKTADSVALGSLELTNRAKLLAGSVSMPTLARAWQMLLKGAQEVQMAPHPLSALEMILIRLCYSADLPDPADLLKKLKDGTLVSAGAGASVDGGGRGGEPVALRVINGGGQALAAPVTQIHQEVAYDTNKAIASIEDLEELLRYHGEQICASCVYKYVQPVHCEANALEIHILPHNEADFEFNLRRLVRELTDNRCTLKISPHGGKGMSMAEKAQAKLQARLDAAREHPVVARVMAAFPDTKLRIREML
jgi:DNA polymerase-3 subunit gamma/tau